MNQVSLVQDLVQDFSTSYARFTKLLVDAMDGCIPESKRSNKNKNIYMTREVTRKKDLKNRLWRRFKRTNCSFDHNRYAKVKNDLRKLTRKQRLEFENNIAQDVKTAPKKFWAYVKSRTKTNSKIPMLRKPDGSDAVTANDKAETLNKFFSDNFTKERIDNVPITSEITYSGDHLNTFVITNEMVANKISNLSQNKSPGPDGWHPIFLKNVTDLISSPLATLFQKSLDEGILPNQWLESYITAIHKKGNKSLAENYRPISITSILCKLMESIVRDQLVAHMETNDILSTKQHGFVTRRNCMTNLLICLESWTQLLESGHPLDIIYTDFAKAFDRVPHQRLLQKLKGVGIVGNTLNWIRAFLSNRNQRVRVDNEFSPWASMISGVPQGSVLGPTLFVLFINDMPEVCSNACQLFADDAKIFCGVKSSEDEEKLQKDLDRITEWSMKWQIPFNVGKCKSLHIGRNNQHHVYKMSNQDLEQVYEEKDLGVLIDAELKFHKQTSAAVKKANSILGLIKKSFLKLDTETMPLLYKTLVRPHLEYGNVVWGPFFKEDMKKVEKVQRRATKIIPELKEKTYEDRLHCLDLPSLMHRRRRGDMIYTYKIMTGKINVNKSSFFKMTQLSTRGHQFKIFKEHATKLSRINTFSQRIVNDWNSLPSKVVTAETINSFKNKLDEHWVACKFDTPF